MSTVHVPILVQPIVDGLIEAFKNLPDDAPPHWIVDCTLGGGGHSQAFLDALAADPKLKKHKLLSVDQDEGAVERGRERFKQAIAEGRMEIVHSRFSEIAPILEGRQILGMMADLGFSSDQIEDPERGLSFQKDGPLDMRLDPSRGESCYEFLQHVGEKELADLIYEYAEERFSRRIAAAIIERRRQAKLPSTTRELAELVSQCYPPPARHGRIHPATRTFQALRIHVNGELEELDCLLENVILSLRVGGRIAILSFHSLEDRKVKQAFKPRDSKFRQLTKKPIEADEDEVSRNPRSRSAKLRIAERLE